MDSNVLFYKGFYGSIEYSEKDEVSHGQVLDIKFSVYYQGDNIEELTEDFHNSVDEFLDYCDVKGIDTETIKYKPNAETLAAFAEVEEMQKNPNLYKRYKTAKELFEDLNDEDD